MNKCLCEEVQPHIIKVNLACPIHGKPEEVKECECVCHGNHPKYKRFLGMYCTHCAPEHLKPSPAKKEPTEREELHWQQMKHACHAHTLDEDQKWEVIERNVKDLLERERQVTRASTLLEAMKTTREYRAKEKEPTGWESTDKFMELAMKFKQWFQDEEIALADTVLGRMASRTQDLIREALENQKQKGMKILMNIAGAADAMIGISLLLVGMYLFFIQRDFMQGAIVLGANSLWSIDKILTNKYLFHPEGK